MAGEVVSTTTTLAGKMERAQADMTAMFLTTSRLLEAVLSVEATDASAIQFPGFPAPSPVSAATEANAISNSAITISAKPATLAAYPEQTLISKLSQMGGSDIPKWVLQVLIQDVCAGFDKMILAAINVATYGFSSEVAACDTYAEFLQAKYTLEDTGYQGPLRAILTHDQAHLIAADLGAKFTLDKNNEFSSNGYWTRLAGVDIWTVPKTWCPQNGSSKYLGAMWIHPFGLAAGYHKSADGNIVHTAVIPDSVITDKLGAAVYGAAVPTSTTGGIALAMA